MTSSAPSIAELRAVGQPDAVVGRASGEHWSGRLYMRRVSPYLTRLLLRTALSANTITWLMTPVGVLAALSLTLPGVGGALGAVALVQVQQLLDCSDGELARWRGTFSAAGIYLDRIAHHVTTAALPIALGIRADGGWDAIGGWTTVGFGVAVLALLIMAETDLVTVARAESGLAPGADTNTVAAPRAGLLRRVRRAAGFVPFYRAFVPVEATLLALAASIVDAIAGHLVGTRVLLCVLVVVGVVTVTGHLVGVLSSRRLR